MYKKSHINLICEKRGLKLYQTNPIIGVSVDGILICDCHSERRVIEIKAPYSLRDRSVKKYGCQLVYLSDDLKLKRSHPYFTQIQIGMGVYGIEKSVFVVWSKYDFIEIEIFFDSVYFQNIVDISTVIWNLLDCGRRVHQRDSQDSSWIIPNLFL